MRTLLASILLLPGSPSFADDVPSEPPPVPRTDLVISGVRPHLTTYGIYSQNGAHYRTGHNECGIGAIVPWAGRLWMVNYAPHMPRGSEHKLFSVDADLTKPIVVHPESVGGTPAGRMIHAESNQLLIGHHLIDEKGNIRTISPSDMPIRVTAIARHLTDPANLVYYVDMEGSIWEANVRTLAVKRLYEKPVPGWHAKGGYTGQGRLVVSNNGEHAAGSYDPLVVGGPARPGSEEAGVLAEWDGENWRIIERRQFTEVTGSNGIVGGGDDDDPIWAIGWDKRSLRLKLLEDDEWSTYLLPKAAYNNDARHGWYTEWPRIREITGDRWMMDMHGMFFDFPPTFSRANTKGLRPIVSHLRYVPDFCEWNGQLVLATDETSIQGNPLAGQPQSNLWFGEYEDLKEWGPATGYGGPWIEDTVTANMPSDPFLVAGFDRRCLHLALGKQRTTAPLLRASDQQRITSIPDELARLPRVTIPRGDWRKPAAGFEFEIDGPATVYLAVDLRGDPKLPEGWRETEHVIKWGTDYVDRVYVRDFEAGRITIPANTVEHSKGAFGMPHTAFVASSGEHAPPEVVALGTASVAEPGLPNLESGDDPVAFTLEVDEEGDGTWRELQTIEVPADGYVARMLPADLDAVWLRLSTDRDCIATTFLHQTSARFHDGDAPENAALFAGLADVSDGEVLGARVYAAKRNRNLRVITDDGRFLEFTKDGFEFAPDERDDELAELLEVTPELTSDAASVIVRHGSKRLRLPFGDSAFGKIVKTRPRFEREVESERLLANVHGTFYELPLVTNGAPPAWNRVRPVASHSKRITDFCSWNGLLVLAGVRPGAKPDGHVFTAEDGRTAVWLGGVDDLWKLGKPVGNGGPWRDTPVRTGVPSDPYLMTGYDRKTIALSHAASETVTMTVQVDIDGTGLWRNYSTFEVLPRETWTHDFPTGFSASWVRVVSDTDTTATAVLEYR